jgi:hypothetical protein
MVQYADFDEVYQTPLLGAPPHLLNPGSPPVFIGSYAPITPAGQVGPFNTNTYFLQDNRKYELRGPTTNRERC